MPKTVPLTVKLQDAEEWRGLIQAIRRVIECVEADGMVRQFDLEYVMLRDALRKLTEGNDGTDDTL